MSAEVNRGNEESLNRRNHCEIGTTNDERLTVRVTIFQAFGAKTAPKAPEQNHRGMYFPLDFESLRDTSFFNNLTCHIITCRFVPPENQGGVG